MPILLNIPKKLSVQVAPNPFVNSANFTLQLLESEACSLTLYNLQGQVVRKIVDNKRLSAGRHKLNLDLSELNAGIYLVKLETTHAVKTIRVIKN